jgi:hydrogenase maturation protein HypF
MAVIIQIKGIVQGVGFRPTVWKLATSLGLTGFVRNDADGVTIEIEGENTERFVSELKASPPPLSKITGMTVEFSKDWKNPCNGFQIVESKEGVEKSVQISPDISICEDCQRELFDESDRRHRYPFINCVNCGPRYSIIKGLPYDRPNTSMAEFKLCPDCAREYADPSDRRYHAQPVACPVCGPKLWFHNADATSSSRFSWEEQWTESIESGKIIAVKGIGGFHLACDALNADAVTELRRRKARENKPFAIMVPDLDWVKETCELSETEEKLLTSRERPIVVLRVKKSFQGLEKIARGFPTLGIMLPYTPMHRLMFDAVKRPLVMTSANYSSEPMIHTNEVALSKLSGLADEFLLHDRDIVNRCDDSVCAVYGGQTIILRPGRGMAPVSFPNSAKGRRDACDTVPQAPRLPCADGVPQASRLPCADGVPQASRLPCADSVPQASRLPRCVLGIGADMKNTFAVAHNGWITLSPYIGDLENPETQEILRTSVQRHLDCYDLQPERIVHDLHPDYFSTHIAHDFSMLWKNNRVQAQPVQHHHAHCIAAAVEHCIEGRAIGVAFDGTGYGTDGTIWGGEILEFDSQTFDRKFHLKPFALPGGEKAVKKPKRTLVSIISQLADGGHLLKAGGTPAIRTAGVPPAEDIEQIMKILEFGINCPMTSSMGRLFDAAAVLLGACDVPTFDGEGPMRLEAMADPTEQGVLPFSIEGDEINWAPMFKEMLTSNLSPPSSVLSARFHNTIVEIIFECLKRLDGSFPVLLSGGVFQNRLLVEGIKKHPAFDEGRMFFSSYPNDSAIALGQAAWGMMSYE